MSDDFYPFVDSGDPTPDNAHLTGRPERPESPGAEEAPGGRAAAYACRIAVYDDMLSAPRVIVIAPSDVRTFLEEITNTVYRCMKEQGGSISLQVIRRSAKTSSMRTSRSRRSPSSTGNTIRFADQGPGIADKERAFEFGVTSADREQKRYIRGTGSGFPIVQDYLTHMGGRGVNRGQHGRGNGRDRHARPRPRGRDRAGACPGAAVRPDCSGWTPAGPSAWPAQPQVTADSATWGGGAPAAPSDPWAGGQALGPQQPMAYPQQMPAGAQAQVAMGGMQAQPWTNQIPGLNSRPRAAHTANPGTREAGTSSKARQHGSSPRRCRGEAAGRSRWAEATPPRPVRPGRRAPRERRPRAPTMQASGARLRSHTSSSMEAAAPRSSPARSGPQTDVVARARNARAQRAHHQTGPEVRIDRYGQHVAARTVKAGVTQDG